MAELGVSDHAPGPGQLLRLLAQLSKPGPARERRIAAGHALFAADGITSLEALADRAATAPRRAA
jgi:hypothetical protein